MTKEFIFKINCVKNPENYTRHNDHTVKMDSIPDMYIKCIKSGEHVYEIIDVYSESYNLPTTGWPGISIRNWVGPYIKDLDNGNSDASMCFGFSEKVEYKEAVIIDISAKMTITFNSYSDSSKDLENITNILSLITFEFWDRQDI